MCIFMSGYSLKVNEVEARKKEFRKDDSWRGQMATPLFYIATLLTSGSHKKRVVSKCTFWWLH